MNQFFEKVEKNILNVKILYIHILELWIINNTMNSLIL